MRWLIRSRLVQALLILMVLLFGPVLIAGGLYYFSDEQPPWWDAKFQSSGQAPLAQEHEAAVVQIYAARAYRWRGVFAVHTWIAYKKHGSDAYERYDVIGWNVVPLTRNRGAGDADWFGRAPELIYDERGEKAALLIPKLEQAIANYPYGGRGGYTTWPGPNSNTFVAHVLRQIPEIDAAMPPHAVGKDFGTSWLSVLETPSNTGWQVSFKGYAGFAVGLVEGVELHFLGETLGVDFLRPALKFPGLGRLGMNRVKKH